jgi:LCP family protein required for cell wall assembly
MSNKHENRNYRGRGRHASHDYRPKHLKESADSSQFVPIDTGAIQAHIGSQNGAGQNVASDPFAPSDYREGQPSEAVSEDAAAQDSIETSAQPPAQGEHGTAVFEALPVTLNESNADAGSVDGAGDAAYPVTGDLAYAAVGAPAQEQAISKYSRDSGQYRHRRFSRGQKIALTVTLIVVAVLFACAGAALAFYQNAQSNISLSDTEVKGELATNVSTEDPYWILILGSDSRENGADGASRSDVILLARIDQPNKKVTLVSIPRDTKVMINGQMQKINAAYSYGASQAVQTVEEFAGINIDHYVEVYFDGFSDLVDDLGGIEVDVPAMASYNGVTIQPGKQTLNGEQALTLARNRKTYSDGDFTRTKCQRLLVQAIATKILSEDVTQIPDTINSISKCFTTDMGLSDVINLAVSMQGMTNDDFYMGMAPSTTGMVDGVSYVFTYCNQWILLMQKAEQGDKPKLTKKEEEICGYESTQTVELDMSAGLPADVQEELQAYWDEQEQKEQQAKADEVAAQSSGSSSSS